MCVLSSISTPLIQQVDICISHQFSSGKSLLKDTLATLVEGVNDDSLLKSINLNILMHTRSEEPQVRLFALTCSEALWATHGNKLLGEYPKNPYKHSRNKDANLKTITGFVAETATFIAECGEDENDMVVKESFRL